MSSWKLEAEELGLALRDFFFACEGGQLAAAYCTLRDLTQELPPLHSQDELEFAFNRLFVGPKAPVAPPYASAYLDRQHSVMGEVTLGVRETYHALGLASAVEGVVPDDHLALELDALLAMGRACRTNSSPEMEELRRRFLEEHVLRWLPEFTSRAVQSEETPDTVKGVVNLLTAWLETERQTLN